MSPNADEIAGDFVPSRSRRGAIVAMGLAMSAVFIYLGFRRVDVAAVGAEIGRADLRVLGLAVAAKLVGFALSSVRSVLLLRPLATFRFRTAFRSVLLAFTANNVIPLRTGEFIRIDFLAREGSTSRAGCMAVVLLERLLDSFVLVALFAAMIPAAVMPTSFAKPSALLAVALATAVGGAVWISRRPDLFVAIAGRIASIFGRTASSFVQRHANTFAHGLSALHAPARVLGAVGATVGFWLLSLLSIRIWFAAFDLALPWYAPLLVLAFVSFGMTLPASPGNLGTYHYFVIMALAALGVDEVTARSVAVVGHAVAILPLTLVGLPFLVRFLLARPRIRAGDTPIGDLPDRR